MTIEYKHTLLKIMDQCRGALEMRHSLDIITTVAACASLDPKQFNKIKEMGASSLLPALENLIKEQTAIYPNAFEHSIELSRLPEKVLEHIVYGLATLNDQPKIANTIREALIDNAGKFGGEFGSSTYMEALIPALLGIVKDKTLLDATCGLARMTSQINAKESYLQEMNATSASLAKRLLLIEGKQALMSVGNSLLELKHAEQKFDLIVMEPPLGLRLDSQLRKEIKNLPYIIDSSKDIPTSAGDALWIQFALHHLNGSGKAYLVLPQGSLFRGGYDGYIREHLLNNELVDKVIALPSGALNATNIEPVLIILDKTKEKGLPIRFVDLRQIGTKQRNSITLNNQQLNLALDLIKGNNEDPKKVCNVTVREIRQTEADNTGNSLSVSHYVQTEEEITLPSNQEQMDSFKQAKQQFEKTQEELFTLLNQ